MVHPLGAPAPKRPPKKPKESPVSLPSLQGQQVNSHSVTPATGSHSHGSHSVTHRGDEKAYDPWHMDTQEVHLISGPSGTRPGNSSDRHKSDQKSLQPTGSYGSQSHGSEHGHPQHRHPGSTQQAQYGRQHGHLHDPVDHVDHSRGSELGHLQHGSKKNGSMQQAQQGHLQHGHLQHGHLYNTVDHAERQSLNSTIPKDKFSGVGDDKHAYVGKDDTYAGADAVFVNAVTSPPKPRKIAALPSLNGTLSKLESDQHRHAQNTFRLLHRAANVGRFASRLIDGLSHRHWKARSATSTLNDQEPMVAWSTEDNCVGGSGTKYIKESNDADQCACESSSAHVSLTTDPQNSARFVESNEQSHHWTHKMSAVWHFLANKTRESQEEVSLESTGTTISTDAPPSDQTDSDKHSDWAASGNHHNDQHDGKVHHHMNPHGDKESHASVNCSPIEQAWTVDSDCQEFSDADLLELFHFYANHKDYSGRKLMASAEWLKFFKTFEEHFPDVLPSATKLSKFFAKNLDLQVDMHFAYGMEKGEASRGLNFECFKVALHEAIGHHWYKTDMENDWTDTMSHLNVA